MKHLFSLVTLLLAVNTQNAQALGTTAIIYNFAFSTGGGGVTSTSPAGCTSMQPGCVTTTTYPACLPTGSVYTRAQAQANVQIQALFTITPNLDSRCNTKMSGSTMTSMKITSCIPATATAAPTYKSDVTCYKPMTPVGPSTAVIKSL